ncbi:hypothetical protein E3O06_10405 [Cryobacterium glaciale]|uniref:Uncharacterized protein n=1 Tax=Cryobacterium glaciale TaxID=1259145 RepID=A0A4R8UX33_9MICO|nr:hypothetical protein [Cryobacterium glaciale]TFB72710.1 hypothetical protein E3O06_10405 [Cryobacterium glaciale]
MFGVAAVGVVIVIGAVDLLVWNPQAKVPALSFDAICSRMIEVDQFTPSAAIVGVTLWAAFWGGLAVTVFVFAARRSQTWMTPRRVSMLSLCLGVERDEP